MSQKNSSKWSIITTNFLGGVAWGLGATVGASIIVAILGFILGKINLVPVVGKFVIEVTKFMQQNNSTFQ